MPRPLKCRRRSMSLPLPTATLLATLTLAACGGSDGTAPTSPEDYVPGSSLSDRDFVLLNPSPPATFQMGSTNGNADEQPVHTVTLTRRFYLQRTEVTQAQWQAVMGDNPSFFAGCGGTCPVEQVSWADIQVFLQRLNQAQPGKNYRLPTEAEWEYAARATTTGDYGGTGVLDQMGWWEGNSGDLTHPVAQKTANLWGLYDMHGNVREWVQDWYGPDYYSLSPATDPTGPAIGSLRVSRGGAWGNCAPCASSAHRTNSGYPDLRTNTFGFRLARTP